MDTARGRHVGQPDLKLGFRQGCTDQCLTITYDFTGECINIAADLSMSVPTSPGRWSRQDASESTRRPCEPKKYSTDYMPPLRRS